MDLLKAGYAWYVLSNLQVHYYPPSATSRRSDAGTRASTTAKRSGRCLRSEKGPNRERRSDAQRLVADAADHAVLALAALELSVALLSRASDTRTRIGAYLTPATLSRRGASPRVSTLTRPCTMTS